MPDNVPVPPNRAPWQISLWGLLFVVPLLVALACIYFQLLQRLDRQIAQSATELAQRRAELSLKRARIGTLASLSWRRSPRASVGLIEEWERQYRFGPPEVQWKEFRYFVYEASDEELRELLRRLRPVGVDQNVQRQRRALRFLADLPSIIPERYDRFRDDLVPCLEDLTKSDYADVATTAERVLQGYLDFEGKEVAP